MTTVQRRERERADTRQRILDAARQLFARDGYEAVTMRGIAAQVEYTPTAIYHHFADKDSLIRELCAADFLKLTQQFSSMMAVADPVERLRRVGAAYVRFAVDNPNHYRLMFMTPPHPGVTPETSPLEHGNPEQDSYAFVRAIAAEAIATGRFRRGLDDPDLVTQVLWAAVHGIAALEITRQTDPWVTWRPLDERIHVLVDAILRGLTEE